MIKSTEPSQDQHRGEIDDSETSVSGRSIVRQRLQCALLPVALAASVTAASAAAIAEQPVDPVVKPYVTTDALYTNVSPCHFTSEEFNAGFDVNSVIRGGVGLKLLNANASGCGIWNKSVTIPQIAGAIEYTPKITGKFYFGGRFGISHSFATLPVTSADDLPAYMTGQGDIGIVAIYKPANFLSLRLRGSLVNGLYERQYRVKSDIFDPQQDTASLSGSGYEVGAGLGLNF